MGASKGTGSLGEDGLRQFVQVADVRGKYTNIRRICFAILIVVFVALPFIRIGGYPAVFINIPKRSFHFFGLAANAQDIWILFFLLTGGRVLPAICCGNVWQNVVRLCMSTDCISRRCFSPDRAMDRGQAYGTYSTRENPLGVVHVMAKGG